MHLPRSRAALERLDRALQRLEEGLTQRGNADLFLAREVEEARADYERLDQASRQVEARIDDVIGRLRTLLDA